MSSSELKSGNSLKWPQYVAGLAGAGGAFASGTALGWPAPAGPRLVGENDRYFPITQSQFDWIASVITIGLAFSCLPIGYLMNKFGRKGMMLVLVVPFLVGWVLIIWAQNFTMMLIGRFILGLAGGCFCISAPQYSTEISEKEIRGILGTFFQLLIIAGILFVYVIGAFIPIFWTNVTCSVFPLIYGVILLLMPESPVFYMRHGKEKDAVKSLKWLRGDHYDVTVEIDALKNELRMNEEATKISKKKAFSEPAAIWSMVIIGGMVVVQQFSGVSVVLFFTTTIFIVSFPKANVKIFELPCLTSFVFSHLYKLQNFLTPERRPL
jgi:MFS family permease